MKRYAKLGLVAAPAAGLGLGIWAEFADLGAPILLVVALPAMAISLASVAVLYDSRPPAMLIGGVLVGVATFAITEGTYLGLHRARGGFLNYEAYESQEAMAAALFAIHAGLGLAFGLGLGLAAALVAYVARMRGRGGLAKTGVRASRS